MTNRATISTRNTHLASDFGENIARKKFDPEGNGVLYFGHKLGLHVEEQCFRFGKMEKKVT